MSATEEISGPAEGDVAVVEYVVDDALGERHGKANKPVCQEIIGEGT